MRIGITFDLKADLPAGPDLPDDHQEEFDSPVTLDAVADVLRGLGHEVELLGDGRELLEKLLKSPPELVFNIAEGRGISRSREARVPAVLEMLGVPYTGSDPLTLAVTLDKECAKRLVSSAGIRAPAGVAVGANGSDTFDASKVEAELKDRGCSYPVLVKPAWEGSSKGIRGKCVVDSKEELAAAVASVGRNHLQPVLIEEFIDGEEVTVGIVGNQPPEIVGIMQVCPADSVRRFVYSLEVKREYETRVRYKCPPQITDQTLDSIRKAALGVYRVLGCRDVARVDFRLRDGVPYFL